MPIVIKGKANPKGGSGGMDIATRRDALADTFNKAATKAMKGNNRLSDRDVSRAYSIARGMIGRTMSDKDEKASGGKAMKKKKMMAKGGTAGGKRAMMRGGGKTKKYMAGGGRMKKMMAKGGAMGGKRKK